MELPGCPFKECCFPMLFAGIAILGVILLAAVGGRRVRCSDYIFGVWHLIAFFVHMIFDCYFLYAPRLLPLDKNATESLEKEIGFAGAVRNAWRQYADADTRIYMDEFQPIVLATAYGAVIGGSISCFVTFIGHMTGCKCTHPMQIIAAMCHLSMSYTLCMPEYLVGFKHITNMKVFAAAHLPFIIMPTLALLVSLCKLCGCCGGGSAWTCCPFSKPAPPPQQAEQKKKQ